MSNEIATFQRTFGEGDDQLFYEIVQGLKDKKCIRIDRLYGDTFSLHFGRFITVPRRPADERGEWIITAWGCDINGQDQLGDFDSRDDADEAILDRVDHIFGHELEEISLDTGTLSLRLRFADAVLITLSTDPEFRGDMWMISLPSFQTLAVNSDGSWRLESS